MTCDGDETLLDRLRGLRDSDMLPMHMPGHKRTDRIFGMEDVYGIDITEIDGFDDLHDPRGVIKDMEDRFAMVYGASHAWLSVNGSTAANEAAILSVCKAGDRILFPRASHKSVYFAVELGRLVPVYIKTRLTDFSSISLPPTPAEVRAALEQNKDIRCVVITSPTYEGLIADIKGIAEAVHDHGGLLIVDSAHGAHMGLAGDRSEGALANGADICVVSLHKMLPAPTQTALVLTGRDGIGTGTLVNRIDHYMDLFISSSPSYVLMAGMGECLRYLEKDFAGDRSVCLKRISDLRNRCSGFKYLDVSELTQGSDPFKLVIRIRGGICRGCDLYDRLLSIHHIQCEMSGSYHVLALITVMDGQEAFDRLYQALLSEEQYLSETAAGSGQAPVGTDREKMFGDHIPEMRYIPSEAMSFGSTDRCVDEHITGMTAGAYVSVYPPGIPVIVPGEIIDAHVIELYRRGVEAGLHFTGIKDNKTAILDQIDNE